MPRHTTLTPTQLLVAAFRRKEKATQRKHEKEIARREAHREKIYAARELRRANTENRIKKQIDRIERYPSAAGAKTLRELAQSSNTPSTQRVRASAILLQWAEGHVVRRTRRRD